VQHLVALDDTKRLLVNSETNAILVIGPDPSGQLNSVL
jgi:hypothetical protein